MKIYAYAFGGFRIPMGVDIDVSICDIKTKPILLVPFIEAIGGDLDQCVPEKVVIYLIYYCCYITVSLQFFQHDNFER